MNVLERFKALTDDCQKEEEYLETCWFEIESSLRHIEELCKRIRAHTNSVMNELMDEELINIEERELPVEDYKLIREKFGEDVANKMYYDVKLGKVPLRFVQRYLSQINTELNY